MITGSYISANSNGLLPTGRVNELTFFAYVYCMLINVIETINTDGDKPVGGTVV